MDAVRTLGHGTLPAEDFATLVRRAGIEVIVDVRRYPGSRRFPHFGSTEMPGWLAEHGVDYRRLVADHLVLVEQIPVAHLFHDGRLVPHDPAPEARRVDHHLRYDAPTAPQLPLE